MSRRYGRNQKRRAREEAEALRQRVEYMSNRSNLYRARNDRSELKIHELECQVEEMIDAVADICQHSTVLPVKTIALNRPPVSPMRVGIIQRMGYNDNRMFAQESIIDVNRFHGFVREHSREIGLSVHVKYEYKGEAAYMISEKAFATMNDRALAREVIPEIIRELRRKERW